MSQDKNTNSRSEQILKEQATQLEAVEGKFLLDSVLGLIPFADSKRAQNPQANLHEIFTGLYKGLFKPAQRLRKARMKLKQEIESKYIDKSEFKIFGAGRILLDALGVERVILCGNSTNGASFALEFKEPKSQRKTFEFSQSKVTITGNANLGGELPLENAALAIHIAAMTPNSLQLWFCSEVMVDTLDCQPDKSISLRGIVLQLDPTEGPFVSGGGVLLSGTSVTNMAIQSKYNLNIFGAKIPETQNDFNCMARQDWNYLFENAQKAKESGDLAEAKEMLSEALELAVDTLGVEYQTTSLMAIRRTIIEIVSQEHSISQEVIDETKALWNIALRIRNSTEIESSDWKIAQKTVVPIYQLRVLLDRVSDSLRKIPLLEENVSDMNYRDFDFR